MRSSQNRARVNRNKTKNTSTSGPLLRKYVANQPTNCFLNFNVLALPEELQLCPQPTLFPPAAETVPAYKPPGQRQVSSRDSSVQAHLHPLSKAGHVYRWRVTRPSGKLPALAGSVFPCRSQPLPRSEPQTSGTGSALLAPLLSTLFQPRGNSCIFASDSSG